MKYCLTLNSLNLIRITTVDFSGTQTVSAIGGKSTALPFTEMTSKWFTWTWKG